MSIFTLFARRNLFLLWLGQVVSQVGNTFNYMALSWLILVLTGSPVKMGGVFLAQLLPVPLLGIPAGVIADRFDRRRLMMAADIARCVLVLSIPLLHLAGWLPLWYIYVTTFLVSAISLAFASAEKALVPSLVETKDLAAANGFIESSSQIAALVGPVAAGILISILSGPVSILYIDAATFLFSTLCLALMAIGRLERPKIRDLSLGAALARFGHDTKAGVHFLSQNRPLMVVMTTAVVVNFAVSPIMVIFPFLADKVFKTGAPGFGWLMGGFGGGMLAGSLLAGIVAHFLAFRYVVFGGMGVVALTLAGMGLCPFFWVDVLLGALAGLMVAPANALIITEAQRRTPPQMLGRVFAALNSGGAMAMPLSIALASWLLEKLNPMFILLGMAALTLMAAIGGFRAFPSGSNTRETGHHDG